MTVLADRGYFSGEQIPGCEQVGIATLAPKPLTSGSTADGHFDKRDFVYDAERDEYRCPAGERAIWRFSTVEKGLMIHKYRPSACPKCPLKTQCTPAPYRRVARWEHEDVLDAMQARLDRLPEASRLRRQTAEHPSQRSWASFWFVPRLRQPPLLLPGWCSVPGNLRRAAVFPTSRR